MVKNFQILSYTDTPLGPLCLRKRQTLSEPRTWLTEVTLNHEFLMSSLNTDSERALAQLAIDHLEGDALRILIGGLGLGYTAWAALQIARVRRVEVIEFLPDVVQWLDDGLTPPGEHPRAPSGTRFRSDIDETLLDGNLQKIMV